MEERFCDDEAHVSASIDGKGGVLDVSLFSLVTPRVRLDFRGCVSNDLNCGARDFNALVTGDQPGGQLGMVGFNSDDMLDFTVLTHEGADTDRDTVNLVVRFGLFNTNLQQIRRRINYGPIVNGLNVDDVLENCTSNLVTVTRLTDGCWTVESIAPDPEANPVVDGDEACLSKGTGRGKNASIELQGTYHMPFLMTLQEIKADGSLASCMPSP